MPTHCKMEALSIFSKICQKCVFVFFNIYNIRKGNEAVRNSGYAEVCFTTNSPLKMLPHHFRYFHRSYFKTTLAKILWKKLPFFSFFQISTMPQNISLWQPLTVKWLPKIPFVWFQEFAKKYRFFYLLSICKL